VYGVWTELSAVPPEKETKESDNRIPPHTVVRVGVADFGVASSKK
jgi:hypothetical protein